MALRQRIQRLGDMGDSEAGIAGFGERHCPFQKIPDVLQGFSGLRRVRHDAKLGVTRDALNGAELPSSYYAGTAHHTVAAPAA